MLSPKVSIIIPNYNHAQFLEQRLESVYHQMFQDFEVILLDDCSTDHSVEILSNYKAHPKTSHFIVNTVNSGSPFKQWQKGISLAQGEFIWIAESDDYCELDFLEQLFKNSKNSGLAYAQSYDVDELGNQFYDRLNYTEEFESNIWRSDFTINGQDFVKDYLLLKNVIPNASAVIFRKELVDDNLFSSDLLQMKMCGDWLFWSKIAFKTEVSFWRKHLNYFRHHKATTRTHNTIAKQKRRLREESILRSSLYDVFKLNNSLKDKQLQKKWFKYFKLSQILSSEFLAIKFSYQSYFNFYLLYFKTKLNR